MKAKFPVQIILYLQLELVTITSHSLPPSSRLISVPIRGSISHILSLYLLLSQLLALNISSADCLTLQLWRDGREAERGVPSTKGSLNLTDYIGCEHSFNLDKEANTIGLIFREMVVLLAFEERETLIKWQVSLGETLQRMMI